MQMRAQVVMAGVLGIYGLIIAVIIGSSIKPPTAQGAVYTSFSGFAHLSSGLACGLSGMAAGIAIGIVGDAGVRAAAMAVCAKAGVLSLKRLNGDGVVARASAELRRHNGIGPTMTKTILVTAQLLHPELALLRDECEVGDGARAGVTTELLLHRWRPQIFSHQRGQLGGRKSAGKRRQLWASGCLTSLLRFLLYTPRACCSDSNAAAPNTT